MINNYQHLLTMINEPLLTISIPQWLKSQVLITVSLKSPGAKPAPAAALGLAGDSRSCAT
jgi:hypothetical protein